jgi:uncharacterized membrane protein YedE/YeeE
MFGFETDSPPTPDLVAHIIQVSLSPVFLLTALGTLLSVFSLRLARVADKVDAISEATKCASVDEARVLSLQLVHFRHRSHALDVAIVLAGIGGVATCASVLTLYVGALRDLTAATVLFALFGLAILCAIGAITAFTVEMLLSSIGIRNKVAEGRRQAAATEAEAPEGVEPQQDSAASG